jgi:zinc D-Ala-D-Ala dipeptidase
MRYFAFFLVAIACNSTPKPEMAPPVTTPAPVSAPADTTAPATTQEPVAAPAPTPEKPLPKPAVVVDKVDKPAPPTPEKVAPKPEPASRKAKISDEFTRVKDLAPDVRLDIRYATTDNFTKAKIYDCPECLLRPAAAKALVKVHEALKKEGYGGLKMFDCYRPRPYQQRLWDKVPNPDYVTPPAKGSMHSRGAAVDLTIVDQNGKELDMGTPYDFFGKEAHYDYTKLPQKVLDNRRLLRKVMEAQGFEGIRTEWWHFSYRSGKYELSDYLWPCK